MGASYNYINIVMIVGLLTDDMQVKMSGKGNAYAYCEILVGDTNPQEIPVTLFGEAAEAAAMMKKGDVLAVQGELQMNIYQTDSGYTNKKLKLIARKAMNIGAIQLPG
jgi:single-stranded DNA-binding protein